MNDPLELSEFVEYRRSRDRSLRNRIIERNLSLAERLARRFAGRGQTKEDLRQVAMLGLLKAVERFEPERGLAFTTFATPTILGELKRHFRDATWSVRVPRQLQEQVLTVSGAVGPLAQELGRAPSVSEIADATGMSEESVLEAMEANRAYSAASIDAASGEDARGPADPAARIGGEDLGLSRVEHREVVSQLLAQLPERERSILELRFWGGHTQSEIAARVGISQMHVSRLLARTLGDLRERLRAEERV